MPRYQVAYKAATKEATVQAYGDATLAGAANIGDFYHDGAGADALDGHSENHVIFHHVQDLLYKQGELNMQVVKIILKRVTAIDASAADVAMNLTSDTTEQITTTFTPADAANRVLSYASSDVTKATVSASGLITAVGIGTATITVTAPDTGVTDTILVTIT